MPNVKDRIGEKFKTSKGDVIEIVEYKDVKNITVRWEDGVTKRNVSMSAILTGNVRKPINYDIYRDGKFKGRFSSFKIAGDTFKVDQNIFSQNKTAQSKVSKGFVVKKEGDILLDDKCYKDFIKWYKKYNEIDYARELSLFLQKNKIEQISWYSKFFESLMGRMNFSSICCEKGVEGAVVELNNKYNGNQL